MLNFLRFLLFPILIIMLLLYGFFKFIFPVVIILYFLSKFISFFKIKKTSSNTSKEHTKENVIDAEYEEVE